ncbi:hypothetical protein KR009_008147 [Drosophila setifemur]|nr:hypothetical protein KR009_008147 [Drosophila setifemur]
MISLSPILALIIALMLQNATADIPDCDYYDTVNITAGERFSNGSFLYEGLLIPAHLTGEYDSRVMADNSVEPEMKHWRGCVCQLKSCIRLCCHHHNLLQEDVCNMAEENQMDRLDPYLNVTLEDGSEVRRHFRTDFVVQSDLPRPCADFNHLDDRDADDGYTLFQNGSLLLHSDGKFLTKMEYCFQPYMGASDDSLGVRIVPHTCRMDSKIPKTVGKLCVFFRLTISSDLFSVSPSQVMVVSLVCMLISIAVYLYVKKLQNLQGKCFVSYMICLFIAYLVLLLDLWKLSMPFCATAGYIGYFFVMATFLWLSVISLHLWFNLGSRRMSRFISENPFLAYNLYAWGVAGFLTGIVYGVDHLVEDNPDNERWMPGVGFYVCWINTYDWSAMIYFYGPMLLLIVFNITMFILTAKRILAIKRELKSFNNRNQRKQKLNSDKQTYSFFLRLFIIMGISWSLEIVSYLVQNNYFWRKVFLAADYLNWSQGTLIFVLFILKPSTLRLIVER